LFASIYFGASKVFKDNNRIAVIVAIVISLMGTLFIPQSFLINIFKTYGLVASIIVWTIPLVAGMFIAHKVESRFFRALIYGLSAWILFSINDTLVKDQGFPDTNFPFFGLLLAIVILLFFWNLFAMFGGEGGSGATNWAGDRGRDIWNKITGRRGDDGRGDDGRGGNGRGGTGNGGRTTGGTGPTTEEDRERALDAAEIRVVRKLATDTIQLGTTIPKTKWSPSTLKGNLDKYLKGIKVFFIQKAYWPSLSKVNNIPESSSRLSRSIKPCALFASVFATSALIFISSTPLLIITLEYSVHEVKKTKNIRIKIIFFIIKPKFFEVF